MVSPNPVPNPARPTVDMSGASHFIANPFTQELGTLLLVAAVSFLVGLIFRKAVRAVKMLLFCLLGIALLAVVGVVSVRTSMLGDLGWDLVTSGMHMTRGMTLSSLTCGVAVSSFALGVYAELRLRGSRPT